MKIAEVFDGMESGVIRVNGGSKPGQRGGVKTSHWIVT